TAEGGPDRPAAPCGGGACQSTLAGSYDLVKDKLLELEAILNDQACADAVLTKKLVKKLVKRVRTARARLAKADPATRDALIDKLVGKAHTLLGLAGGVL